MGTRIAVALGCVLALGLSSCTVSVNTDDTARASGLFETLDVRELVEPLLEEDVRAAGVNVAASSGSSVHADREYRNRTFSTLLNMPVEDERGFAERFQRAMRVAIETSDVAIAGESAMGGGENARLEGFGFTYTDDALFGWVDVYLVREADGLRIIVSLREAQR